MAIDQLTLGKKLKQARISSSVTQEAAAEALGVPRTAIVHIEAGNRSVSLVELSELAALYHRDVPALMSEEVEEEDLLVAFHRVAAEARGNPEVDRQVLHYAQLCRVGYQLETMLARRLRPGPPAYDVSSPSSVVAAVQQGSEIAEEERKRLSLGCAPIPDMADLLSSQGIWAAGADFPDAMSGVFLLRQDIRLVILVNYHHHRGRKRFSYAHEFAHALLDRRQRLTVTTKQNASDLIEKRANAFAASFLVPKAGVDLFMANLDKGGGSRQIFHIYDVTTEKGTETERRTIARNQEVTFTDAAALAAHYGVSYQVAVYRLSDLGYLGRQEVTALIEKSPAAEQYLKLIGRWDDVAGKPQPTDRNLAGQLLALAMEAYRRDEITADRLREIGQMLSLDWKAMKLFM